MEVALVLAALVAAVHGVGIVYVVLGGFLGLRDLRWMVPHFAIVTWMVASDVATGQCPLTVWEKLLIALGGGTPYDGLFITHYYAGTVFPTSWEIPLRNLGALMVLVAWATVAHHWLSAGRLPCSTPDRWLVRELPGGHQREQGEQGSGEETDLQRPQLRGAVVLDDGSGPGLVEACLLGSRTHLVGVDEVDAVADRDAHLRGDLAVDALVRLDRPDEAVAQPGEHDGTDQGDTEGGAELLPGVLQPAGLAPTRGVDR